LVRIQHPNLHLSRSNQSLTKTCEIPRHDEAAVDPSYWTSTASKEDLHSYIMNHLDGLGDGFTEPIRATSVEGIFHPPLQMRDMTPPVLPQGRVTLLGDAVHPMVPFRGEGGNMAMKDGMSLAKTLDSYKGGNIQDMLKLYEAEMSERTTKSVLASRAAALA
jgi:2-polyprenyl-6-methoxyphenol hydroxylase-like FAD-dependent oxidoreductase